MSRLIIGNQLTEETADGDNALPPEYLRFLGNVSHRIAWLAAEGDVLVLPSAPAPEFLEYVWECLGIAVPPVVVVPPPGRQGSDLLYDDRLAAPELTDRLSRLVAEHGVEDLLPFYYDAAVQDLAQRLGLDGASASLRFLRELGGELVNSKAAFRAMAAGNGANLPEGRVVSTAERAESFAWSLLSRGEAVIVKQDLHGGGYGNELLSPVDGVEGVGVNATVHIPDREALHRHLRQSWSRYTYDGARRVVIEHYIHDSKQLYVEFELGRDGAVLANHGGIRMKPILNGLEIPAPVRTLPAFAGFQRSAQLMADAVWHLGYRGFMGLDAIVTPGEEILFNEINARVAGSTHIHVLMKHLVGPDYLRARSLVSRNRCAWQSFPAVRKELAERGLAFSADTGTGVLLLGDDGAGVGPSGQILIVARSVDQAASLERRMLDLLGQDED